MTTIEIVDTAGPVLVPRFDELAIGDFFQYCHGSFCIIHPCVKTARDAWIIIGRLRGPVLVMGWHTKIAGYIERKVTRVWSKATITLS